MTTTLTAANANTNNVAALTFTITNTTTTNSYFTVTSTAATTTTHAAINLFSHCYYLNCYDYHNKKDANRPSPPPPTWSAPLGALNVLGLRAGKKKDDFEGKSLVWRESSNNGCPSAHQTLRRRKKRVWAECTSTSVALTRSQNDKVSLLFRTSNGTTRCSLSEIKVQGWPVSAGPKVSLCIGRWAEVTSACARC